MPGTILNPTNVTESLQEEMYETKVLSTEVRETSAKLLTAVTEGPESNSLRREMHTDMLEAFKNSRIRLAASLKGSTDSDFDRSSNEAYVLLGKPSAATFERSSSGELSVAQVRYAAEHDPLSRVANAITLESLDRVTPETYVSMASACRIMALEGLRLLDEGTTAGRLNQKEVDAIGESIRELAIYDLTYRALSGRTENEIVKARIEIQHETAQQEAEKEKKSQEAAAANAAGWNTFRSDRSFR